ncbi:hypothetical protein LI328DRAFT_127924 [Trichoderma asperelloides]|nr:hypothetical protein LI328DRAFT_127924 [Trichoderma asperelloides]
MQAHLGLLLWLSAVSPSAFGGLVILIFVDIHKTVSHGRSQGVEADRRVPTFNRQRTV